MSEIRRNAASRRGFARIVPRPARAFSIADEGSGRSFGQAQMARGYCRPEKPMTIRGRKGARVRQPLRQLPRSDERIVALRILVPSRHRGLQSRLEDACCPPPHSLNDRSAAWPNGAATSPTSLPVFADCAANFSMASVRAGQALPPGSAQRVRPPSSNDRAS